MKTIGPGAADGVELGEDLGAGLDPRAPAEGDDDVAELALERASARELQAAEGVVLHLQQVEPRRRDLGHVGLLGLLVALGVPALPPFVEEPRPGFLGLADEDHVGQVAEIILLDGHPRAARHAEAAALLQLGEDLLHAEPLHAHPRDADDVGPLATLPVDRLDVLVDQGDRVLARRQRRQQRQARHRQVGPLADERQGMLHAPVRDLEPRIDQHDISHRWACPLQADRAAVTPEWMPQSRAMVARSDRIPMCDKIRC